MQDKKYDCYTTSLKQKEQKSTALWFMLKIRRSWSIAGEGFYSYIWYLSFAINVILGDRILTGDFKNKFFPILQTESDKNGLAL